MCAFYCMCAYSPRWRGRQLPPLLPLGTAELPHRLIRRTSPDLKERGLAIASFRCLVGFSHVMFSLQERSSEDNVETKRRKESPEESTKETEVKVRSTVR